MKPALWFVKLNGRRPHTNFYVTFLTMIDAYCERTGPGLLGEPLNALSNASFLIAAWAAWRLARRQDKLTAEVKILIVLGYLVGIGSILWHTYPTNTTLILDVVPIVLFIIWYIWLYARHVIGAGAYFAAALVAAFVLATYIGGAFADVLHGAPVYTPGLLVVVVLGTFHALNGKPERYLLLVTAGIYFVALFFRTIDQEVCAQWPIGTHFLWHSLIGLVTYLAMRSLILSLPSERESS